MIKMLERAQPGTQEEDEAYRKLSKVTLEITEKGRMRRWRKAAEESLPGSVFSEGSLRRLEILCEIGDRKYLHPNEEAKEGDLEVF
ncbi:hypothetical protein AGMMS49921_11200 [Endomicrobiia bacterium]|nr:hypothetical protein AGMMS49921_11200 [Endomicrobiia bacterium]